MSQPAINPMNQYAPPTARVEDVHPDAAGTSELNYWSSNGRIGRLRYLAYTTGASLIQGAVMGAATLILGSTLGMVVTVALYIAGFWFGILCAIKRCHDVNISGWWCLTLIVPILAFVLIFVPGTKGSNRFGAPPPANTTGVKILGMIFPVVVIIGIVAAIALPAYVGYKAKAQSQVTQPAGQR